MPAYNVTIDDVSPTWVYSGNWTLSDTEEDLWANSTFHITNQAGSAAQLSFGGTAIYVHGQQQPSNASYTVILDGRSFTSDTLRTSLADGLLFSQTSLEAGPHFITIKDTASDSSSALSIDGATVTFGDGDDSTTSIDTILDDVSPNITYNGNWDTDVIGRSNYFWNKTRHAVGMTGASANISFYGDAIVVFGAMTHNHATYLVSLDDDTAQKISDSSNHFLPQQILYTASNLTTGGHNVVLTVQDDTGFTIDYAVVSSWAHPQPGAASSSSNGRLSVGAIAGITVGAVLACALLALLALLFIRSRRRRQAPPEHVEISAWLAPSPTILPSPRSQEKTGPGMGSSTTMSMSSLSRSSSTPRLQLSLVPPELNRGLSMGDATYGGTELMHGESVPGLLPPAYEQATHNPRVVGVRLAASRPPKGGLPSSSPGRPHGGQ